MEGMRGQMICLHSTRRMLGGRSGGKRHAFAAFLFKRFLLELYGLMRKLPFGIFGLHQIREGFRG